MLCELEEESFIPTQYDVEPASLELAPRGCDRRPAEKLGIARFGRTDGGGHVPDQFCLSNLGLRCERRLVPEVRIELTTYPLPRGCATTTLLRHNRLFGFPRDAKRRGRTYS